MRWLLVILVLSSCAYFNAYYNAQKLFKQAEERRAEGKDAGALYEEVIRKASKVVAFYPSSRWVDDSLLLLGKALYRKGEYERAAEKFRELRKFFPESELSKEARYWEGMALGEVGRREEAISALLDLAEGKGRWACRAKVALGDLSGDPSESIAWYEDALGCAGGREKFSVGLKLAGAYRKAGKLEEAEALIRKLLRREPPREVERSLVEELAEVLSDMGKYDDALEMYKELGGSAGSLLGMGRIFARMGDEGEALKVYAEVAGGHPKTREAVRAWLETGKLLLRSGRWKEARDAFGRATEEGVACEEAREAKSYKDKLDRLMELKARADSTGEAEDRMALGEFLLSLDMPDSALAVYRGVLEDLPDGELAPRALYAVGWILQNCFGDTSSADSAFDQLLRRYPESEQARALRGDGGRELFLKAEGARLSGRPPDEFLPLYEDLLRTHPESLYAPRAAYAIAWTYENVLKDSLKAIRAYQEVAERFPDTEQGRIARRKLSLLKAASDSTDVRR